MKPIFLILSFLTCILHAQEIKVKETKQFVPAKTGEYTVSGVSPDGKQLLVTTPKSKGLYLIDLKSGKRRVISELPGAGYEPVFSSDGRYLCFKSDEYLNKRKVSSLQKIDLITGDTITLESGSRNLSRPVVAGNNIVYLADGNQRVKGFQNNILKSSNNETYILLEELTPVLYVNGVKKIFKPGGDGSYIWVSLSPDKTKILYLLVGKGTFVCDLNGNILASPGKLNAPKWLNNQIIIGMDDKDDGHKITSSEIVAFSIASKKKINITSSNDKKEMYPYPFADGKRIAFSTSDGRLFIITVEIK